MLSQFGVDVKTSKSAVLSEATDYIAHLQRQQAQSEAERARLLQLLHNTTAGSSAAAIAAAATGRGGGLRAATAGTTAPHGRTVKPPPSGVPLQLEVGRPPAAAAAAAAAPVVGATRVAGLQQQQQPQQMSDGFGGEGGIALQSMLSGSLLSLNGDGDVGKSATATATAGAPESSQQPQQQTEQLELVPGFPGLSAAARSGVDGILSVQPAETANRAPPAALGGAAAAAAAALSHVNYERVFRTAPMPMAIANVNGNLVDCNTRLSQVTGFRRDEVLFMTIFDLVADPFLQHTFRCVRSSSEEICGLLWVKSGWIIHHRPMWVEACLGG